MKQVPNANEATAQCRRHQGGPPSTCAAHSSRPDNNIVCVGSCPHPLTVYTAAGGKFVALLCLRKTPCPPQCRSMYMRQNYPPGDAPGKELNTEDLVAHPAPKPSATKSFGRHRRSESFELLTSTFQGLHVRRVLRRSGGPERLISIGQASGVI